MNLYINNYLSGIEVINSTLKSQKNKLSHERVEKIMSNLDQLLHNLEHHVRKEKFTPFTEPLKPWIVEVLQTVHQTLGLYDEGQLEKIESIKQRLLKLQSSVETQESLREKKVSYEEIVTIAYFCDLHIPDHNGAISWSLKQAMTQGIPLITTRSLLLGKERSSDHEFKAIDYFLAMQKVILENKDKWDIYQNGEAFVFIPHTIFPELKGVKKLEAFDFRTDGLLKKSSVEAIFEKAATKSTIHDVIDLFSNESKVDSIFYVVGHGGAESVAALNEQDYRTFLNFLYHRRCKGLAISSCASGGKSSLMNIPEQRFSDQAGFLDQQKSHPFPILVRSIGDFLTYTEQPAELDLRSFLDEFNSFIHGPHIKQRLCQNLKNVEKGHKKTFQNLVKFYPAHSAGIPGGFRPADEDGTAFALTYNAMRKSEIEAVISKDRAKMFEPAKIIVKEARILEIHPLVTPLPLFFEGVNPILLSMTPGSGHHFVKALELQFSFFTSTPLYFLKKTIDYHKKDFRHANKGFFIGEIKCNAKMFRGIALKITPSGAMCVGKDEEGNCFFTKDGVSPTQITPFLHGMICREIMSVTHPEKQALTSMSAGQESEAQFEEAVYGCGHFSLDFDQVFNLDDEHFLENMKSQMQRVDREAAVIFLLENGNVELAFRLFKNENLDPNMKKFDGSPLLFFAIRSKDLEMIRFLLSQGVDINIPNAAGRPALNQAIIQLGVAYKKRDEGVGNAQEVAESEEILELLLNEPSLNLEALNSLGWTAITHGMAHSEIMKMLIKRGAKVDYCHSSGRSLLSTLVSTHEHNEVEILLEYDPDPNLGSPTALTNAFRINDTKLVRKLLEAGGTPFQCDTKGQLPFIDAIFWTSPETMEMLLERGEYNPEISSKNGMFPLLAALLTGNKEKIEMIKSKKFIFPASMTKDLKTFFKFALDRHLIFDEEDAIADLLKIENAPHALIAEYLFTRAKEPFLKKLIENGIIDMSVIGSEDLARLMDHKSQEDALGSFLENGSKKQLLSST